MSRYAGMSKSEAAAVAGKRAMEKGRATIPEAAAIFGKHPQTVQQWANAGKIGCVIITGRTYIPLDAIVAKGGVLPSPEYVNNPKGPEFLLPPDSNEGDPNDYYN